MPQQRNTLNSCLSYKTHFVRMSSMYFIFFSHSMSADFLSSFISVQIFFHYPSFFPTSLFIASLALCVNHDLIIFLLMPLKFHSIAELIWRFSFSIVQLNAVDRYLICRFRVALNQVFNHKQSHCNLYPNIFYWMDWMGLENNARHSYKHTFTYTYNQTIRQSVNHNHHHYSYSVS